MQQVIEELRQLHLFRSMPHVCSYLDDREASSVVIDPTATPSPDAYAALLAKGFRRSGSHLYRPSCARCSACVSIRIPTQLFKPARRHRRVAQRNRDIRISVLESGFHESHYRLYQRYTAQRHAGGDMASASREEFMDFLTAEWSETLFIELRLDDVLLAVAVTDRLPDGLSAVYTFFEPTLSARSPGVAAILQQVELARSLDLPWLYLGYWIESCRKMSYKADYRPLEAFLAERWLRFEANEHVGL